MHIPPRARLAGTAALAALGLALAACGSSNSSGTTTSPTSSSPTSATDWATAQSVQAGGGMNALVAAAKKEGTLNVIALPPSWAKYAPIISTFKQKYGLKVNSENPNGASADEINALQSTK